MIKFLLKRLRGVYREYKFERNLKQRFPSLLTEQEITIKGPLENMSLGDNVQFQHGMYIHLGGMDWCENQGNLKIGNNACFSPYCVIYAAGPGGVEIGDNFDSSSSVKIFSSLSLRRKDHVFAKVKIGNDVSVGAHTVISHGVTIGDNVIIGSNTVVLEDIPSNVFIAGSPAKIIRHL